MSKGESFIFTFECSHGTYAFDARNITSAIRQDQGTHVTGVNTSRWIPVPHDLFCQEWRNASKGFAQWTKVEPLPPPLKAEDVGPYPFMI
jgi:hypothetical protein